MWYIIDSGPVQVDLPDNLKLLLEEQCYDGLSWNETKTVLNLRFEGEGFDLEDYSKFFSCATKEGVFMVHFEDHKGDNQYGVEYGPDYCEEG